MSMVAILAFMHGGWVIVPLDLVQSFSSICINYQCDTLQLNILKCVWFRSTWEMQHTKWNCFADLVITTTTKKEKKKKTEYNNQGSHGLENSWKSNGNLFSFSRPGKSWNFVKNYRSHEKVMDFFQTLWFFYQMYKMYRPTYICKIFFL